MSLRRNLLIAAFVAAMLAGGAGHVAAQAARNGAQLLSAGAEALGGGQYKQAARTLTQAMRSDTLSAAQIAKALYLRGVAQRNLDKPAHAISDLTSALWLQGLSKQELAQAHLNRGLAYEAVGMNDLAREDSRRAREIDPNSKAVAVASAKRSPAATAFDTRVEAAVRKPKSARVPGFQTQVTRESARTPKPAPVPSFQTQVTRESVRKPKPAPLPDFQTQVRTAAREVDPVPAFRTSIVPEEQKKARQQPAPSWTTAVADDKAKAAEASGENKPKGTVTGYLGGLWRRATGDDDNEKQPAEPAAQRETPPAASSQWSQTTTVDTSAARPAATPARAPLPPVEPAPAPAGTAKSYRIQLAAVRSEDEAQSTWKRLAAKHRGLLGQRQPLIEKTDVGSLGTFYRIQIGPFADKKESAQLCSRFKSSGVDCFLVAR